MGGRKLGRALEAQPATVREGETYGSKIDSESERIVINLVYMYRPATGRSSVGSL